MQKLQLSIPEPCHENWQNMTPTEQGRFCNACAKEVVDFSMMTDREVLNYFSVLSHEKVCGRALPSQLDRHITMPKEPKKRLFWYWNYIVMFLMFFSKANYSKAQKGEVITVPVKKDACSITLGQMVAGVQVNQANRVITGRITDKSGLPIPFASLMIIDSKYGVAADANGDYKMAVSNGSSMQVSAVGYQVKKITISDQTVLNVALENFQQCITARLGGLVLSFDGPDSGIFPPSKQVAVFKVKEDKTELAIEKAKIVITKGYTSDVDTAFTDKKGSYMLKGIKKYENYNIKIEADGYNSNEFTINGSEFNERKEAWDIFLTKKTIATGLSEKVKGLQVAMIKNDTSKTNTRFMLGQASLTRKYKQLLLVVDDIQLPISCMSTLNPNDVESVKVLKGSPASALYGSPAYNGVIIVTTKKKKAEDKIKIAKDSITKSIINKISDTVKLVVNTSSIKIYPNPVQKGNDFLVSLKQQQINDLNIQVIDMQGRVMLQRRINAAAKEHLEKIETDSKWGGVFTISGYLIIITKK